MADINRSITPVNNKNIMQPTKEYRNSEQVPFDFRDASKVKQTTAESSLSGQHNVIREDGSTAGFFEILHDPDVSSAFLKNIFLLREIVGILPLNNSAQTEEMKALLDKLVLTPEEIAGEMMKQEDISTIFKGGIFDMLRDLTIENSSNQDFSTAVTNLLKAINNESSKSSIFESVEANFESLKGNLGLSSSFSEKIDDLCKKIADFRASTNNLMNIQDEKSITAQFAKLKSEIFSLFKDAESSVLYNGDISKTFSLITYNLSRLSVSTDAVPEAFTKLLEMIDDGDKKENLTNALLKFLDDNKHVSSSKTMNALTELLKAQSENPDMKMINSDSMEKIIHSLLSSPCNFTPLLHFVVPVEYEDIQASAEIWVNPDGEDDVSDPKKDSRYTHILAVFDIQDIGNFEVELFVEDKNIDLTVLCPQEHTEFFKKSVSDIRNGVKDSGYKLKSINVDEMKEPRSLIEVFKSLPLRRQGVNVTV
ncbi:MAG: hypothetical protein IKL31_09595 [Ruminococcus sp.]|nr:hypothetical protein [Ruminococcus sp.]